MATAQDVAADQSEIDSRSWDVTIAEQNRRAATLTSPISGTVAAVGLAVGDGVSAGSTSATVTVVGGGQYTVSTTVPLSAVDAIRVGQRSAVTVNGRTAPLTGTVTTVGVLASTTGSTPTYPVTVLVDAGTTRLYDGSGATVAVTTADLSGVLTVPSSAVHTVGSAHSVDVLRDGAVTATRVEIGAVGPTVTQVTSGLSAGDQVVLADLGAPLPTATSSSRSGGGLLGGAGRAGGGAGFGGGTGFGGGARGGR
ncbi:hypothetical protein GCM10011594_11140 [Nakamurella endophytica]|uniref:Multidrug resistance protein MdtA-like C-terminal permuted SH3 domain-containing protein n=1 Tax=Nakamurella endophytica TaxID=1748367 RepID=A0A917SRX1_9ACTN|nr:hypothetical protein GCM10011594_11140 [Nakamurella endophytica]